MRGDYDQRRHWEVVTGRGVQRGCSGRGCAATTISCSGGERTATTISCSAGERTGTTISCSGGERTVTSVSSMVGKWDRARLRGASSRGIEGRGHRAGAKPLPEVPPVLGFPAPLAFSATHLGPPPSPLSLPGRSLPAAGARFPPSPLSLPGRGVHLDVVAVSSPALRLVLVKMSSR